MRIYFIPLSGAPNKEMALPHEAGIGKRTNHIQSMRVICKTQQANTRPGLFTLNHHKVMFMPASDQDPHQNEHDRTSSAPTQKELASEVPLSPADKQLLQYLHEGLTIEQIALRRNRRPGTVGNQLSALYQKLGVNTRAKAIALTAQWARNKTSNL